jgi:hypothetical protein
LTILDRCIKGSDIILDVIAENEFSKQAPTDLNSLASLLPVAVGAYWPFASPTVATSPGNKLVSSPSTGNVPQKRGL